MSLRFLTAGLLVASAVPALAQEVISPTKLTDNELTCRQIVDEVKQMEQIVATAKSEQEKARQAQLDAAKAQQEQAQSATNTMRALSFVPFLGLFGAGASIAANVGTTVATLPGDPGTAGAGVETAQKAANAAVRMSQASARQQYLTSLFNSKGCKLSEVEGRQAEKQGRDQAPRTDPVPQPSGKETQEAQSANLPPTADQ